MKMLLTLLMSCSIVLLCSCQNGEADSVDKETVEGFIIETMDKTEGLYEVTGYKKVNAITYMKEDGQVIITRVQAIEDYYNNDGDYIKTVIYNNSS